MKINNELVEKKATHIFDGVKVKIFSTSVTKCHINGWTAIAEVLEGENKGKWTTIFAAKTVSL